MVARLSGSSRPAAAAAALKPGTKLLCDMLAKAQKKFVARGLPPRTVPQQRSE